MDNLKIQRITSVLNDMLFFMQILSMLLNRNLSH